MNTTLMTLVTVIILGLTATDPVQAQPPGGAIPVTVDNFIRAETDMNFAKVVKMGGFGKSVHLRELAPADDPSIVRPTATHYILF